MSFSIFKKSHGKDYIYIPINLIILKHNSNSIDKEKTNRLCHAINSFGMIYPVIVRSLPNGTYELILGEDRLRAVKSLGHKKVLAYILNINRKDELILRLLKETYLDKTDKRYVTEELFKEYNLQEEEIKRYIKNESLEINKKRLIKVVNQIRKNKFRINNINTGAYADYRILQNTIRQGTEYLRNSGVRVHTFQKENNNEIEIRIKIQKNDR